MLHKEQLAVDALPQNWERCVTKDIIGHHPQTLGCHQRPPHPPEPPQQLVRGVERTRHGPTICTAQPCKTHVTDHVRLYKI